MNNFNLLQESSTVFDNGQMGIETKQEVFMLDEYVSKFSELNKEKLNQITLEIWQKTKNKYTKWDILALIQYLGEDNPRKNINYIQKLLFLADMFDINLPDSENKTFSSVKAGIKHFFHLNRFFESREEMSVQSWAKDNLESKYPNSNLVKVFSIENKRPDFLININNVIYPVECKIKFGNSGLKQLQNYMKLWEVDKGIAVAEKLTVKLPSNIDFYLVQY